MWDRRVVPVYSRRNTPRSCRSGTTELAKSSSPLGKWVAVRMKTVSCSRFEEVRQLVRHFLRRADNLGSEIIAREQLCGFGDGEISGFDQACQSTRGATTAVENFGDRSGRIELRQV